MSKSLSLDIRERVLALVDDDLSCHEAARRLRISAASAVRIMQRKRRTGEVKPRLRDARAVACQLALNFDPLSASNIDPLVLSRPGAA